MEKELDEKTLDQIIEATEVDDFTPLLTELNKEKEEGE